MNGYRLTAADDEAYDLVVAVASGDPDGVHVIADRLSSSTREHG